MNREEMIIFSQQLNLRVSPVGFCPYCDLSIAPQESRKENYHQECWEKLRIVEAVKKKMLAVLELLGESFTFNMNKEEIAILTLLEHVRDKARSFILLMKEIYNEITNTLKSRVDKLLQEIKALLYLDI